MPSCLTGLTNMLTEMGKLEGCVTCDLQGKVNLIIMKTKQG